MNTTTSFIVPPGCTIVMKAHCGEPTQIAKEYVRELCKLPEYVLLDPTLNAEQIIDSVESVAIYTSGDSCPDIDLLLLSSYPTNFYRYTISSYGSGIIDLLDIKAKKLSAIDILWYEEIDTLNEFEQACSFIANHYRNSVLPTQSEVLHQLTTDPDYFMDVKGQFRLRGKRGDLQTPRMKNVVDHVIINQLFNMLARKGVISKTLSSVCTANPGIYYNFICRGQSPLFNVDTTNSEMFDIHRSNLNLFDPLVSSNLKKQMRSHIAEAEYHRKPFIKRSMNSRTALRNTSEGWTTVNRRKTKRGGKRGVRK